MTTISASTANTYRPAELEAISRQPIQTLFTHSSVAPAPSKNTGAPVLEVEVNTFIPQDQVTTPALVPGGGTFAGDGRDIGEDGTQRTQQTIQVYPDASQPSGYRVEIEGDIGQTHKLDENGNVIQTGEASENDLQAEVVEVRPDGTIVVHLQGQSANPLVGVAPGITYDMTIEMRPNPDGTWTVSSTGTHDSFPGYEVLATGQSGDQQVVYGYDPRTSGAGPMSLAQGDGGIFSLWGGSQETVDGSLTVGPETLTPQTLIDRHTNEDGTIDTAGLGTDLAENADAGNVDPAFVSTLFAALPADQRADAANAFFDNLQTTSGFGGGTAHDEYVSLATSPAGMDVILAVGAYAPERLGADEIVYGFASQNRETIYNGDPAACSTASAFLDALSGSPEAQQSLAQFLDPLYDNEEQGIASTPEGRALDDQINRIVD